MKKYKIMGANCFQVETIDSSKRYIKSLIANSQGGYSTAINAEKIMMYSKDIQMKDIIDNSI